MKLVGERFDIQVEVCDDHLLVIFPQKCGDVLMPWQSAMGLGETLQKAAEDIPQKPLLLPSVKPEIVESKLDVRRHRSMVALIFDHTDRVKLSYEAARYVGRELCRAAQDQHFEKDKGVYIQYDAKGRKGQPTPAWDQNRLPKTLPTH